MRQQAQTVQADVVAINITGMLCYAARFLNVLGRMTWAFVCYMLLAFHLYIKDKNSCSPASCSLKEILKLTYVHAHEISLGCVTKG